MKEEIKNIEDHIKGLDAADVLKYLAYAYPEASTFSTSFGPEDQVLSHMIFSNNLPIIVFTLDTGRLFDETYAVWNSTLQRYKSEIKVFFPKNESVQDLLQTKGPYSFYESVENRKECCYIRKVEPLKRALTGSKIWITGIRAGQSSNRTDLPMLEWDEANKIIKIHPLLNWTFDQVNATIKEFNIPYNPLHDKGFVSIGCKPCTRAVKEGEDFRAGRWWWEDSSKKECGLHK